jgi:protein SCO1/2
MEGLVSINLAMRSVVVLAIRALAVPALLAAALWVSARPFDGASFVGMQLDAPAPPLVLFDDRGEKFDLKRHRGGVVLVYFGYTHCPDICPGTLTFLQAVWQQLGTDADRVEWVFVTLDPSHDTPDVLREFLSQFNPVPVGLTGAPAEIATTARAWGMTVRPAKEGAYFDHTSLVAAVGPDGRQRLRYGFGQLGDAAAVARDLKQILHSGREELATGVPRRR